MARADAGRRVFAVLAMCMAVAANASGQAAGVVPGSYRLFAQDASGRQVEATAGAPGRITGSMDCPITLIGQAEVVATSVGGAAAELRVADGAPPAMQAPRPHAAMRSSPGLWRFDVLVERDIAAATMQRKSAEFDIRYAHGATTQTFRWPVVLDLQCISHPRTHR